MTAPIETFLAEFTSEVARQVAAILAENQPAPEPEDKLLSLAEVGEMLGRTERTVRKYISGPEPWLSSVTVGKNGSRMVWRSEVLAKLDKTGEDRRS